MPDIDLRSDPYTLNFSDDGDVRVRVDAFAFIGRLSVSGPEEALTMQRVVDAVRAVATGLPSSYDESRLYAIGMRVLKYMEAEGKA